jgi:hypothetical protein
LDTFYYKSKDSAVLREAIPYLTAKGIELLYTKYDTAEPRQHFDLVANYEVVPETQYPPIVKKGVWFSPTNANRVNGLNIGLQTMNIKGDTLKIHGMNLNADVLSAMMGMYGLMFIAYGNKLSALDDTVMTKTKNQVTGLSISGGGIIFDNALVEGLSINGGIIAAEKTRGVVLTGTQSMVNNFNGLVVSGLRNVSVKGKGVQVGLLNVCKHLKGVQFGLWNVNSKRKLPFINWDF